MIKRKVFWRLLLVATFLGVAIIVSINNMEHEVIRAEVGVASPVRRVNVPFLGEPTKADLFEPSIFWFAMLNQLILRPLRLS